MTLDLSRMMMRQLNRRKDRRTRKGKPDAGAIPFIRKQTMNAWKAMITVCREWERHNLTL